MTNLPAEAKAKWIRVMEAKTPEEKIQALQDFLSHVPKHKGTENLVMWARRRMAELREQAEKDRRKSSGRGLQLFVEKDGAGQVILLGDFQLRCTLMRALTKVKQDPVELPVVGMTYFEDVRIQLVNPPYFTPESRWASRIIGMARNAEVLLLTVRDHEEYQRFRDFLSNNGIDLGRPRGRVILERMRTGSGVRVVNMGKLLDTSEEELRRYVEGFGFRSAIVKIMGEVGLDDVERAIFESGTSKPAVLVSPSALSQPSIPPERLEDIRKSLFIELDVIRVYTKEPFEPPTKDPLVLRRGSTVADVAKKLHTSLYEGLTYARVWGKSARHQGQRVGPDWILEDGDVVEIHVR